MGQFGLNVKTDQGGKRVELECEHQNGLLYVVPAESSWGLLTGADTRARDGRILQTAY